MANAASLNPEDIVHPNWKKEKLTKETILFWLPAALSIFSTLPGLIHYSFPLYNLADAERLRSRLIGCFEDADRNPLLIDRGVLNFVIVGAGPTGTESRRRHSGYASFFFAARIHRLGIAKNENLSC